MSNYADDFKELTVIFNNDQGYTDKSNIQSAATRIQNSGPDFFNNYMNDIERVAYDDGYTGAVKDIVIGVSIIVGIVLTVKHIKKRKQNKENLNGDI